MRKKILVFEFITGGGLVQQSLPKSLANEGQLMLSALLKELCYLDLEITVLLDWRYAQFADDKKIHTVIVKQDQNVFELLPALIEQTDQVWPIAPEMHGELFDIATLVENQDKILLNSTAAAIANCSDKYKTYTLLKQFGIATITTYHYQQFSYRPNHAWVIKPRFGMGCINSFYLDSLDQFTSTVEDIKNMAEQDDYIVQPYVTGDHLSLSCLFKEGKGWLICCNRQKISRQSGQFELTACIVNIDTPYNHKFQQLVDQIAKCISGLWGYVGIDIIVTKEQQVVVVEINPRLTTSYTGINHALGINVAETIINMPQQTPRLNSKRSLQYPINLQ